MFVLLMFNFLVGSRWSFHLFERIVRLLSQTARRLVIVGADSRGAAAVQHLHSTIGANAELLGLLDADTFKHGKLFHGYPVLGSLENLDAILARTPFEEIVIAQETLSASQLASLESFAQSHHITLRRFMLGVTDMTATKLSESQLTPA
jgi:FlaA1/EpsC-like NDP-sugar epimerase